MNFQTLVDHKKISPGGREWLKAALDPFHDKPLHVEGYPDGHLGWSLVHPVKFRRQIVAPVAADWDCMVTVMPIHGTSAVPMYGSSVSVNLDLCQYNHTLSAATNIAAVVVTASAAGGTLWPPQNATTVAAYPMYINNLADAPARIIAGGFEVIDVTPEFYRSGQCTVGVVNSVESVSTALYADTSAGPYDEFHMQQTNFGGCPSTAAVATQVPNSVTWPAKEGCYVALQMDVDADRHYCKNGPAGLTLLTGNPATSLCGTIVKHATLNAVQVVSSWSVEQARAHRTHFACFSGLDQNVRLNLETRAFVESNIAVTGGVLDPLALLATPTCPYDRAAIDLYRRMLFELPPGVPQSFNPAGEWFRKVLSTLGSVMKIAGPVITGLSVPLAAINPAVGLGATIAGTGVSALAPLPSELAKLGKKKKKKPNGK